MAYDLNFSLLGAPVDVPAAVNAGYEHGRDLRLRGQQERAFSLLAHDPNSVEGRALLVASGHPDQAHEFRTWAREDRRDALTRYAFGGGAPVAAAGAAPAFPGNIPPAPPAAAAGPIPAVPAPSSAPASPAASPQAPAASTGARQLNPQVMRQFFAEDPAGALELQTKWNDLNTAQQAQAARQYAAAVPILSEVARLPVAQRGAAVMAQAPYLISNGWTQEELQAFAADPNDQTIHMLLRRGVPIADQHQFFAPVEGGAGQVYRDPITMGVTAANPSPSREEHSYDANGNEIITTVPGQPAIGPGHELFGTVAPSDRPGSLPQPGSVVNGHRYRGPPPTGPTDPALRDRNNWEAVQGGAPQPNAAGTFPGGW